MGRKIKTLTIVTAHEVCIYESSDNTTITEQSYFICGEPYPCYHVKKDGKLSSEIRSVCNIIIDYFV